MSNFVTGGGKIDAEGFLKPFLLFFRPGQTQGLQVTQRGAGANMTVDIQLGTTGTYAGALMATSANIPYFGWIDAIVTGTAVSTADPTNPRIDVLVGYVDLSLVTSSTTDNTGAFKFKAVTGTPAGSPVAPNAAAIQSSIGAGNPYVILANIAVGAAVSSIVTANITDKRVPSALAVPYIYGGSSNTNGHQVPNVADAWFALTSRSDGKVDFAALLSTIFSGQVQTQVNSGTGGGTINYVNLGGLKLMWGTTGSFATNGAGQHAVTVIPPTSFFTAAPFVQAVAAGFVVDTNQHAQVGTVSTSSVQVIVYNITGSGGAGATVSYFAVGL